MSAKLLEFYGLSLNSKGVTYFLMVKEEDANKTFQCDINLAIPNDPEFRLIGVIFGAQQSMVLRKVRKSVLLSRQRSS